MSDNNLSVLDYWRTADLAAFEAVGFDNGRTANAKGYRALQESLRLELLAGNLPCYPARRDQPCGRRGRRVGVLQPQHR